MRKILLVFIPCILLLISCSSNKKSGDQFMYNGITEYTKEEYLDAVESFQKAIELGVNEFKLEEVYTTLGNTYCELEMYDKAIENHKKAIEIDDEYCEAWINLGISYRQEGDYDMAEEAYSNAIKIDSNSAELHSSLGSLYIIKNEPQKAIEEFELAVELNPSLGVAFGNGALAYAMIGDFENAELFLERSKVLGYENYDEILKRINLLK